MRTVYGFRHTVGTLATLCIVATASNSCGQNNSTTPELRSPGSSRLTVSQEKDLTSFYASRLFLTNHSATILSKIASTRANNPALRKFAANCLREHNKMAESLRPMVPSSVATMASHKASTASPNQIGRDLDDDNGLEDDDLWDDSTTSNTKTKQTIVSRVSYTEISDPVLRRVAGIERGVANTRLQEASAFMNRLRGQEFDMAFIHHNIASCENLLIELTAVSSIGSPDFQTLVGTANRMITTHLTAARELAESSVDNLELDELEGDEDWDEDDEG